MKIEIWPVKNEGLGGVAIRNRSVTLYNDSGCALYTREYCGSWEAKRGLNRLLESLARDSKLTAKSYPRSLKHPIPYISAFDYNLGV